MFKRTTELQSLLNESRRALAEAEAKVAERNKLIKILTADNIKKDSTFVQIEELAESNNYGNADIALNKIRELIRDCNTKN